MIQLQTFANYFYTLTDLKLTQFYCALYVFSLISWDQLSSSARRERLNLATVSSCSCHICQVNLVGGQEFEWSSGALSRV